MMKRLSAILLLFLLISAVPFSMTADEMLSSDDGEMYDDFDLLFDDAAEDIIIEEAPVPVVDETSSALSESGSTVSSVISFTGSFSGNVGAAAVWADDELSGGGVLSFTNTLFMTAKPASDFTVHASVKTTESNLTLDLSSFYFDYLWKSVFISAGKKSLSWGNIRMFNTETYGVILTNPVAGFDPLTAELRFTLAGSWTFAGSGDITDGTISWNGMKYALAYENNLGNTNIDFYGTYIAEVWGAGLELKRTIGGFDFYGQGLCHFEDETHKIVGTTGFYRLWETEGPDYGINFEYQYVHDETADESDAHKIALETGIKQMGKRKNLKLGTQWGHDFSNGSGFANVAFLISGIFPHANWTNAVGVKYEDDFTNPEITIGSTISISIDY